ncbi:Putative LOC101846341, partial [Caligus rogercresseyi]
AVEDSRHDKSVSFHPNTTIMEPAPNRPRRVSITSNVNVMDLLPEDKETNTICEDSSIFLEDVTDRSSGEELWQIRTGITKTTDGELTLCKTLMQSQNLSSSSIGKSMSDSTAWAYDRTLGGYTKSLKDSHRYTKPGHISFNESLWDNSLNASDLVQKAKPPKLNLSSEKINLVFVKKYPLEQIPQAITVDDLGYKYISHPDGNKITMLRGNDKK